jgi:flagellar biosynthesis protein FliQ
MIGVALALLVCFPWMLKLITAFTTNLFVNLPLYVR